jgi:hypothetical protein
MFQLRNIDRIRDERSTTVNGKKGTKKKGALRPWLVDVSLDHLR